MREAGLQNPKFEFNNFFNVTFTIPEKKKIVTGVVGGDAIADAAVLDGIIEGINEGIREGICDTVNDTVNDTIKARLIVEIIYLHQHKAVNINSLCRVFGISRPTAMRDLLILKGARIVKFYGAPKTGKYSLTPIGEKLFTKRK